MDHGILALIWAAIVATATFGFGWAFRKGEASGENKIKNQQRMEELKDIEETNKRREDRNNIDVSDMRDWLRNYASRKKQ